MRFSYLDVKTLNEMLQLASEGKPAPRPVGYGFDVYNHGLSVFLKTDRETGHVITDKNGKIGFNWRAQKGRSVPQVEAPTPAPEAPVAAPAEDVDLTDTF